MKTISLWIPFFLSLFAFLFYTAFFSSFRLFYFAPFIVIAIQRLSLQKSLWIAAFCGLALDLFCSATRLGLYALLTVICVLLAYRLQRWFFQERLFSLPLYTALISWIFGLLQCAFFKNSISFLFLMPLFDGLYAFLWFTCPISLLKRRLS